MTPQAAAASGDTSRLSDVRWTLELLTKIVGAVPFAGQQLQAIFSVGTSIAVQIESIHEARKAEKELELKACDIISFIGASLKCNDIDDAVRQPLVANLERVEKVAHDINNFIASRKKAPQKREKKGLVGSLRKARDKLLNHVTHRNLPAEIAKLTKRLEDAKSEFMFKATAHNMKESKQTRIFTEEIRSTLKDHILVQAQLVARVEELAKSIPTAAESSKNVLEVNASSSERGRPARGNLLSTDSAAHATLGKRTRSRTPAPPMSWKDSASSVDSADQSRPRKRREQQPPTAPNVVQAPRKRPHIQHHRKARKEAREPYYRPERRVRASNLGTSSSTSSSRIDEWVDVEVLAEFEEYEDTSDPRLYQKHAHEKSAYTVASASRVHVGSVPKSGLDAPPSYESLQWQSQHDAIQSAPSTSTTRASVLVDGPALTVVQEKVSNISTGEAMLEATGIRATLEYAYRPIQDNA